MSAPQPPRLASLLIRLAVPAPYRDDQLGDLQEGFARRWTTSAPGARRWYWRQALRTVGPGVVLRARARRDDRTRSRQGARGSWMESFLSDLRQAVRSLRKSPLFGIVSMLTLALAIGVCTAVFSLVSTVVFADLPMQDQESVAVVRSRNVDLGIDRGGLSGVDYLELRERSASFERVAALADRRWVLTSADAPTRVQGQEISANLLDVWRLPPVLGRDFAEGEDQVGAPAVAMLTYPYWQARYAGSPMVLGQTVSLDGTAHTIVGVADRRLGFLDFAGVQVLTPLKVDPADADPESRSLFVTARLRAGVEHAQASEETAAIGQALARARPGSHRGWELRSAPAIDSLLSEDGRATVALLVLTVTFVLLIACANVANMVLARGTVRAREMSIRAALGAGRWRLVRQAMAESTIVSLAAGLAGLGFARLLLDALIRISRGTEPAFLMADLDLRVLAFALAVSFAAPLLFALFPAVQSSRSHAADALREGPRSGVGVGGRRSRTVLVGVQVALALTLMVVSGLLVRTMHNLTTREPGFDPAELTTIALELSLASHPGADDRIRFYDEVVTRLARSPGIQAAGVASSIPGVDFGSLRSLAIEGRDPEPETGLSSELVVAASPEYFEVTGIPIVEGRNFEAEDDDGAPVAILSREVARIHWPGESAVGSRIRLGAEDTGEWRTVVGVVGDVVASSEVDGPARNVYLPYAQSALPAVHVVVRSSTAVEDLAGPIREVVWAVDPNQPVGRVQSVESAQATAAASGYAILTLFVIFAVFALLMAALGIYGVVAYSVSRRRSEIGLRMALGAEAGSVRRLILAQGAKVLAVGGAVGLLGSVAVGRLLSGVVYGVTPTDPLTFLTVSILLGTVGLLANLIPAIRATRTHPVEALRAE